MKGCYNLAKFSKSISFKSACIDYESDMIIETLKDETKTYKLSKILREWNGVDGINITFKKDDELDSDNVDEEYKDEFREED